MNNLNVVLLLFAILNSDILKGKEYLKRNNNMYYNTEHRHDYDVIKLPLHHGSKYVAFFIHPQPHQRRTFFVTIAVMCQCLVHSYPW